MGKLVYTYLRFVILYKYSIEQFLCKCCYSILSYNFDTVYCILYTVTILLNRIGRKKRPVFSALETFEIQYNFEINKEKKILNFVDNGKVCNCVKTRFIYSIFKVKEDNEKVQHLEEEYKKEVNDKENQVLKNNQQFIFF